MFQHWPKLLLVLLLGGFPAWAAKTVTGVEPPQSAPEEAEPLDPAQRQRQAVWQAALAAMVRGPATVALRDQATIAIPDGFGYVPAQEAGAVMHLMGNRTDGRFLGLVYPLSDDDRYVVSLDYEDSGYIKDDEAKEWDADELLSSLKEGTEAGNAEREKMGIDPIKVTRWIEPPAYDATNHRLVWSAEAVLKNGADPDPTINYNTYVLGREGYVSANLISSASTVDADRQQAAALLRAVSFNDSKRYTDFESSTDKVAAYGLTALVGGLAAKKLGLLAVIAGFAVKFAKLIAVAVLALLAGLRRFFTGKADPAP